MGKFKHEPFKLAVKPAENVSHTFTSGVRADFYFSTKSEVEALALETSFFEAELYKINPKTKAEKKALPKDTKAYIKKLKKQIAANKRKIKKLTTSEKTGQAPKAVPTTSKQKKGYYDMSKSEYDKLRKNLESVYPKGLERKWMMDKKLAADTPRSKQLPGIETSGKVDPRGGGTQYNKKSLEKIKSKLKNRGIGYKTKAEDLMTEEEFILAKAHFARLVAGFAEVVTRYWECSPHVKNPECRISSYSRGFPGQSPDLGNHGFGIAADAYVVADFNGKRQPIPVLQYWNSLNLLIREGRLPNSKVGLYLNLGTSKAHDGPIKRPDSVRGGMTGATIYTAGQDAKAKGAAPGSSGSVHYDFQGFFGVSTMLGKRLDPATGGIWYLDLDLNGNGTTDLYASQSIPYEKGQRRFESQDSVKSFRATNRKEEKTYKNDENGKKVIDKIYPVPEWGLWNKFKALAVLSSPNFNRSGIENLNEVNNYIKMGIALRNSGTVKLRGSKKAVLPFDNFLHEVDDRVPNLLQVLGLEGEKYIKELGLDK